VRSLQGALRKITETLAAEVASSSQAAPPWSLLEWRLARAVAAMHGVSPLLASTLQWQGAPEEWTAFLVRQRTHTAERFSRIRELLSTIDDRARADDIRALALKGAELHALGLYAPGTRPMADVDLLVREQDHDRTVRLLESLGYVRAQSTPRHLMFQPRQHRQPAELGEHSKNDIKIELHTQIREHLPIDPVDITGTIFPAHACGGLNSYPSQAALMTHLLLHAAGMMVTQSLRLLHLNDIRLLTARMADHDWDEFLGAPGLDERPPWWAFPPLHQAARYFSCIPARVLNATEASCPRSLARVCKAQQLSDVSLSYLRIDAFPGMQWATSLDARVRYAIRRIKPSREVLEWRSAALDSEPRNARSDWARSSQLRRILRWLTSTPARMDAMAVVEAALEQSL
jgi:hypothetical protein